MRIVEVGGGGGEIDKERYHQHPGRRLTLRIT
jgi:hypothetical protein